MKRFKPDRWVCVWAALVVAVILGSASNASAAKKKKPEQTVQPSGPVFFPAPPEAPRVQYLTTFSDGSSLTQVQQKKKKSSFADWVTGAKDEGSGGGSGSDKFSSPYGIGVHNGKIYICDIGAAKVHVLDLRNHTYGKLGGKIQNPVNITIDTDGTKYVCDSERALILVYDANDQFQREFGQGMAWSPTDLAIDGNEVFVTNPKLGCINVLTKDGTPIRMIGKKGNGPDELGVPTNLAIGLDHRIYVSDMTGQMVKVYNKEGQFVGTVGSPGSVVGQFARPKGIAIDDAGILYVVDTQWGVVQLFTPEGRVLMAFGQSDVPGAGLAMPAGVAIDKSCIDDFRSFLAPNFEPQHLVFVVNQFGMNKIGVYAYGRDKTRKPEEYEVNMQKVKDAEAARAAAAAAEAAKPKPTTQPKAK